MISRKKKLRIAQISLLILGLTILFFTYANKENNSSTQIISKETQERIKKDLAETSEKGDIFYNIEYSCQHHHLSHKKPIKRYKKLI